mmetsp:Transcript_17328/g.48288  ORF Transcript_17328/g.48288 Transcript_17328/m.48288 type:complete len:318 (+) Transcript_17328:266-1219(+)
MGQLATVSSHYAEMDRQASEGAPPADAGYLPRLPPAQHLSYVPTPPQMGAPSQLPQPLPQQQPSVVTTAQSPPQPIGQTLGPLVSTPVGPLGQQLLPVSQQPLGQPYGALPPPTMHQQGVPAPISTRQMAVPATVPTQLPLHGPMAQPVCGAFSAQPMAMQGIASYQPTTAHACGSGYAGGEARRQRTDAYAVIGQYGGEYAPPHGAMPSAFRSAGAIEAGGAWRSAAHTMTMQQPPPQAHMQHLGPPTGQPPQMGGPAAQLGALTPQMVAPPPQMGGPPMGYVSMQSPAASNGIVAQGPPPPQGYGAPPRPAAAPY